MSGAIPSYVPQFLLKRVHGVGRYCKHDIRPAVFFKKTYIGYEALVSRHRHPE